MTEQNTIQDFLAVQDHPTILIIKAFSNMFFVVTAAILVSILTGIGAVLIGLTSNVTKLSNPELIALGIGGFLLALFSATLGYLTLRQLKNINYKTLINEMNK